MQRRLGPAVRGCAGLLLAAFPAAAQNVSFVQQPDISVYGNSIVSGDFNGDVKPDLAAAGGAPGLTLLLNDGSGGFIAKSIKTIPAGVVAAADLNKDGKLDLVMAGPGLTFVLFGKGDGTFGPPASLLYEEALLVADFNGDGNPDLLFPAAGFYVRLGNGDGTFQEPSAIAQSFNTNFFSFAAAGDFNGDGIPDVAYSSAWHDGVTGVWLGNGDGTFREGPVLHTGDYYGSKPLVIADFNRDGELDVAVALGAGSCCDLGAPGVEVFLGNADGTFRPGVIVPTLASGSLVAADFNGDGKLDLAIRLASGPAIVLGNGDGTFQPPAYFPDGHSSASAEVAVDLTGDGRPDLVLISSPPNDNFPVVSLLFNNSPGSPGAVSAVPSAGVANTIAPDSLASIYGSHLAGQTAAASGIWPTELGGIQLHVRDSALRDRLAQLIYVSPAQINFLVPAGTALGWATLTIDDGTTFQPGTRATMVTAQAPGFFTVDGNATGVAAATAIRVLADGTRQDVPVSSCSGSACTAVPIDLSAGAVYLTLYGSGFRNAGYAQCDIIGTDNFQVGTPVVTYSGPQSTVPGLDQVNMLLKTPIKSGIAFVNCGFSRAGNSYANAVQIRIK